MDNAKEQLAPIGSCNFRNQKIKFGIKLDDRRRHVYMIGKTGVGKTTLLENMVIADMQAGRGVAVIDPHGEFAERMINFVPEKRLDDVIYVNPADMEYPIAFNPMEQVNPEFRHLVASGLMGVFKKIFVDVWSARMAYILNNTLLALLEYPGSTLLGIMRMYSDPVYRKKIVENLKDPVVKAFWLGEYAKYTQRLESEAVSAIQNKIGQFISNPLIRNILGQAHSTLNMREIMDSGKIFIVNLSKGKVGEDNSALLGAMIITRLQLAAMSRVDITNESKRRDFFLYVDEFQNFATDSFANILSEARKYRLSLILAHQYIGQLIHDNNTKVRDAVFGNVGTIITFRVGGADAEDLEKEFMPEFLQNDLVNLDKANVYVKLMIDGVTSRPFSAETLPPQKQPLVSYEDVIIQNSRNKYSTPRKVVEAKIASEWQVTSESIVSEKISRQGERSPRQVLQSQPQEWQPARHDNYGDSGRRREDRPSHSEPRFGGPPRGESRQPGGPRDSFRVETNRNEQPREFHRPEHHPEERPHPPVRHESHGDSGRPEIRFDSRPPEKPVHNSPSPENSQLQQPSERPAGRPASSEARSGRPRPPEIRHPEPRHAEHHLPPRLDHSEDTTRREHYSHSPRPVDQSLSAVPKQTHPKIHPKQSVDINELRKAISESLGKSTSDESVQPITHREKPLPNNDSHNRNHGDESGEKLYGTDEDRDELAETLSLEELAEKEERSEDTMDGGGDFGDKLQDETDSKD